jgi:hypothetical protein
MSVFSPAIDRYPQSPSSYWSSDESDVSCKLDLSESRTYDCVLEILNAYKLTGNFLVNLEIVLKDLGVFERLSFEVKPKSLLSDCRHVEFLAHGPVPTDEFNEIMRSIERRVGFDPARPLWTRLFRITRHRGGETIKVS